MGSKRVPSLALAVHQRWWPVAKFLAIFFGAIFLLHLFGKQVPLFELHTSSQSLLFAEQGPHHQIGCAKHEAVSGDRYRIFRPACDDKTLHKEDALIAPPEAWTKMLESRLTWLDTLTMNDDPRPTLDRARSAYLQVLLLHVSGLVYGSEELSVAPLLGSDNRPTRPLDKGARDKGGDWTYLGMTMTGLARLKNVHDLLIDVIQNNVPGDYIETGVWRGGSSIFARGVIRAYGEGARRRSFVCDSFSGLPPGDRLLDQADLNWDNTPYLEVSTEIVSQHFRQMNMLDPEVVFAKGLFNDTMGPLAPQITSLSTMRLDGDMYESTVDVLYHLYDKLEVGGYVIMDDWFGFPSRAACEDFFAVHGIQPEIVPIDGLSVYWQKTEQVEIQFWRYRESKFKP